MCTTKKPKTVAPPPSVKEKELPILRNPYIDGLNAFSSRGVSSLRIDRAPSGTTNTPKVQRPEVNPGEPTARPTPPQTSNGEQNLTERQRLMLGMASMMGGGAGIAARSVMLRRFTQ